MTQDEPSVGASRDALSAVLTEDDRARLDATDDEPDAIARLRARQRLANDLANERLGHRPTGERRPDLTSLYEERFRAARNGIVESAPRAEDWEEIGEALEEGARHYEPTAGDRRADEDARRVLEADGAEVPR